MATSLFNIMFRYQAEQRFQEQYCHQKNDAESKISKFQKALRKL